MNRTLAFKRYYNRSNKTEPTIKKLYWKPSGKLLKCVKKCFPQKPKGLPENYDSFLCGCLENGSGQYSYSFDPPSLPSQEKYWREKDESKPLVKKSKKNTSICHLKSTEKQLEKNIKMYEEGDFSKPFIIRSNKPPCFYFKHNDKDEESDASKPHNTIKKDSSVYIKCSKTELHRFCKKCRFADEFKYSLDQFSNARYKNKCNVCGNKSSTSDTSTSSNFLQKQKQLHRFQTSLLRRTISKTSSGISSYTKSISRNKSSIKMDLKKSHTKQKSIQIKKTHNNNPVELYELYQRSWKKHKLFEKNYWKQVRWNIRKKHFGGPDIEPVTLLRIISI